MSNALQAAVQTFIRANRLPPKDLTIFQGIKPGDYDTLYATLACLLPEIPVDLHHTFYEIATASFTPPPDFSSLRQAFQTDLIEPSVTPHTIEHTPLSPASNASNYHPESAHTPELSENDEDYECNYPTSGSNLFGPTLTCIPFQEASEWTLGNSLAFTRPRSCHRSLLYHAGYFPFARNFGVPYFSTEAPADSHRLYDDAPRNGDAQKHREEDIADIVTLADAHRPWRRRWYPREVSLLKEMVARRADEKRGGTRTLESIEYRKIAASWSVDAWDSLAVQAGGRLSGRPGHALMCKFLNGEHGGWQDGEDAFLRSHAAVNACLREAKGGWDVVGAAIKRPGMACLRRWQEIHVMKKSAWSHDDDSRLRKAVSVIGPYWSSVALMMGDRSGPQCMHRYVKQLSGKRTGKWSTEETQKLEVAVKAVGSDWIEIARRVGSRNDVQCREKWVCGLDPRVKDCPWEKNEDEMPAQAVEKFGHKDWASVAGMISGRNETQCRRRLAIMDKHQNQLLNQQKKGEGQVNKHGRQKAGRWSREELEKLTGAVSELGNDWDHVAERVGSRGEKQCREKWATLLQTGLTDADAATKSGNKAGRWAREEMKLLNDAVQHLGQSWTEVGKRVGSRDEAQCREKWISLQHGQNEMSWNRANDEILRTDVEVGKADGTEPNWHAISEKLKRDQLSCRTRYDVLEQRVCKKRPSDSNPEEGISSKRRKQGRWSLEETRLLKSGLERHGQDFDAIAEIVKTRNESQCREKWYAMLNAAAIDATWTAAEDNALVQLIEQNGLSWETIGESMPGRSLPQCRKRWKVLREQGRSARLGRWKPAETATLKAAYNKFGEDWEKLAEKVGSRNDWQCRQKIGLGWRTRDDEMLYDALKETGKKWKEVKKRMPGFSEVMCKRRWRELEIRKKDCKVVDADVAKDESVQKEDMMKVADVVKSVAMSIARTEGHIKTEDVMRTEDYHADAVATVQELVDENQNETESRGEVDVVMPE